MNSISLPPLQKVSRVACVFCLLLLAVYCGHTIKALIEHGWTMPWWGQEAPTQEIQAKLVLLERFRFWYGAIGQCICYGLFAALFSDFGKGRVFTRQTVRLMQYLAIVFFVSSLLRIAEPALFGLSTDVARLLLMGIDHLLVPSVTLIAAWVMREGSKIQEDQALTI